MDAKPRRRYLPRFSLRTLVILVLLAASGFGLWWRWEPWLVVMRLGGHKTLIRQAEYAKDGSKILTNAESDRAFTGGKTPQEDLDETVVWDARSGARLCLIEFGQAAAVGGYGSAELTGDGQWVHKVYGYEEPHHALFDSTSGQAVFPGQNEVQAQFLLFSADEKQMVVQFPDKTPELWDMDKRECRVVLDAGGMKVERGEFMPDGQRFVLGGAIGDEAYIAVFDAAQGQRLYLLKAPLSEPFVLLPGGRRLLCTLNGQMYSTYWTAIVETPTDLYIPFIKGGGTVGCVVDLDRAQVTENPRQYRPL